MWDTEQRFVLLARSGDKEAFSELVSLFEARVYRVAYALTGNEHDAKDLSQETFVKAYRGIAGFRTKSSFFTWLYRILLNTFKSWLRKRRKVPEPLKEDDLERVSSCGGRSSPDWQRASDREDVDRVYRAICSLPDDQRMVMVMRCLEEMTYAEISRAMRCPVGTVKSRIHAARLSLIGKLHRESDSPGGGVGKEI